MPANQALLEDSDILEMADDVLSERIVPLILSTNQNYFVTIEDVPTVVDQAEYDIPVRAMGRGLRDLKLMNAERSTVDMALIALEDAHKYAITGLPSGFYFQGDQIVLVPTPVTSAYTLQMFYNMRPSKLVSSSRASQVVGISGDTVTVGAVGTDLVASASVDFIRGSSACRLLGMDTVITGVSGTQLTFGVGAVPLTLKVGDDIVGWVFSL